LHTALNKQPRLRVCPKHATRTICRRFVVWHAKVLWQHTNSFNPPHI
jgi:hypothetical protein